MRPEGSRQGLSRDPAKKFTNSGQKTNECSVLWKKPGLAAVAERVGASPWGLPGPPIREQNVCGSMRKFQDENVYDGAMSRLLVYSDSHLHFDGIPVEELARAAGTPLYVYSRREIENRYRSLDLAFSAIPHRILYSVKANSSLGILNILTRLGAGADVVSGGELTRALMAGMSPGRIVFAGVGKTDEELRHALVSEIGLVNVESPGEFARLLKVSGELGKKATVAFRITPGVVGRTHEYTETGTGATKFGMPLEEAVVLARSARNDPRVEIRGLHAHFGSQIMSVEPFVAAVTTVRSAVERFRAEGVPISVVNLGGGLGIQYAEAEPPLPAELADAVIPLLADLGAEVLIEPGRFLVGPAGLLLARVIDVKRTGSRTFGVVDAAMNDLIRPALYGAHHEAMPVHQSDAALEEVDLVGPICESGDFLARGRRLPTLSPGDLVAFRDAGAYGFSMSSNYNSRPRAAEVLIENASWRIIRRRETVEDLMRGETT
jgi:diaminopimelate decarboxylase